MEASTVADHPHVARASCPCSLPPARCRLDARPGRPRHGMRLPPNKIDEKRVAASKPQAFGMDATCRHNMRTTLMENRIAQIHRQTKETDVAVELNLDGVGKYEIDSGVGFLDHMLTHLSKHSRIDLVVKAKGDLQVDAHHTVEDIAICLGECLLKALSDKKGIARYGHSSVPMEDALANVSGDLSGRPNCIYNVEDRTDKIGAFC